MDRTDIVSAINGQKISQFDILKIGVKIELEKMSRSHQNQ